jgi:hypothetical protein
VEDQRTFAATSWYLHRNTQRYVPEVITRYSNHCDSLQILRSITEVLPLFFSLFQVSTSDVSQRVISSKYVLDILKWNLESNRRNIPNIHNSLYSSNNRLYLIIYEPRWLSRYNNWLQTGRQRGSCSSPGRVNNFHFSISSKPALGLTELSVQLIPGTFPRG